MGNILILLIPSGNWTGRAHSYLVDAGLGVQEEELDGGVVLQVGDAFYIESARETACVRREENHCIEQRSFRGLQFPCWMKKRQRGCQSFRCYLLWGCAIFIPMCTGIFLNIHSRPTSIWEYIPAITKHLQNVNQKPNAMSTYTTLRF